VGGDTRRVSLPSPAGSIRFFGTSSGPPSTAFFHVQPSHTGIAGYELSRLPLERHLGSATQTRCASPSQSPIPATAQDIHSLPQHGKVFRAIPILRGWRKWFSAVEYRFYRRLSHRNARRYVKIHARPYFATRNRWSFLFPSRPSEESKVKACIGSITPAEPELYDWPGPSRGLIANYLNPKARTITKASSSIYSRKCTLLCPTRQSRGCGWRQPGGASVYNRCVMCAEF